MSDFPQGPDWWKASDGRWYAPPATDDGAPPVGGAPPSITEVHKAQQEADQRRANIGCWSIIGGIVALIILIAVVDGVTGDDGGDDGETGGGAPSGDELKYGAFDVCTQFVEDRLRAPGTASFPNAFEDDGEVRWSSSGDQWTVSSHVDAENGFGGEVRTPFVCTVRHVAGENWRLVSLDL